MARMPGKKKMEDEKNKGPGRPGKEIDTETRKNIEKYSRNGLTWSQLALVVGISERTLQRHCEEEFKRGKAGALATVTGKLWENIENGHPASIFFYLKTQGGGAWKETTRNELVGEDGGPIKTEGSLILTPKVAAAISHGLEKEF